MQSDTDLAWWIPDVRAMNPSHLFVAFEGGRPDRSGSSLPSTHRHVRLGGLVVGRSRTASLGEAVSFPIATNGKLTASPTGDVGFVAKPSGKYRRNFFLACLAPAVCAGTADLSCELRKCIRVELNLRRRRRTQAGGVICRKFVIPPPHIGRYDLAEP
jgi:hypothetical protein